MATKAKTAAKGSISVSSDVLTLEEAAAFFRTDPADVLRLVGPEGLPGRIVGGQWRFLKSALEDWLRTSVKPSSKEAMQSVIGAWKDDQSLDELLADNYRHRGRPMTEERK